MKKTIILIGLLAIQIALAISAYGQNDSVHISINTDKELNKDSLEVFYKENYFSSIGISLQEKIFVREESGAYKFKFPRNHKFVYLTIRYQGTGKYRTFMIPDLIVQSGDSIQVKIANKKVNYTGKGVGKYNLLNSLNECVGAWQKSYSDSLKRISNVEKFLGTANDSGYVANYPKKVSNAFRSNYSQLSYKLNILSHDLGEIDTLLKQIIRANLLFKAISENNLIFKFYSKNFGPNISETFTKTIQDSLFRINETGGALGVNSIPPEVLYYSSDFHFYIAFKTIKSRIYGIDWLKANFKGELLDRLITVYFAANYSTNANSQKDLENVIPFVKTRYCIEPLRKLMNSTRNGNAAYNFSLPNEQGRTVKLDDLKGKKVVLDFWYTGCVGCAELSKVMKPIMEELKGDPSIAFVSINIDKRKTDWLNSLKGGLYTNHGCIDLYTNGLAKEHPIIKHYKIESYPRLIIIGKDGKIISANPNRPVDGKTSKEFIAFLKSK